MARQISICCHGQPCQHIELFLKTCFNYLSYSVSRDTVFSFSFIYPVPSSPFLFNYFCGSGVVFNLVAWMTPLLLCLGGFSVVNCVWDPRASVDDHTLRIYIYYTVLIIFLLLFSSQVSGITLIITAAVIQGLYSTYLDFLGNEFLSAPMLFIIVGVVIFLVAFFGCCGAVRENNCMMITVSGLN